MAFEIGDMVVGIRSFNKDLCGVVLDLHDDGIEVEVSGGCSWFLSSDFRRMTKLEKILR